MVVCQGWELSSSPSGFSLRQELSSLFIMIFRGCGEMPFRWGGRIPCLRLPLCNKVRLYWDSILCSVHCSRTIPSAVHKPTAPPCSHVNRCHRPCKNCCHRPFDQNKNSRRCRCVPPCFRFNSVYAINAPMHPWGRWWESEEVKREGA